jgi:3-phenylpropionate/trans-cinnamate dioxygenase ferredoxin subunit
MSQFITVAKKIEIPDQTAKCVQVGGKRVALFNLNGTFFAIDDACTHMGGALSEGLVQGNEVVCPLHGARFAIGSGEVTAPPAQDGVTRYNVHIRGEEIEIEM